MRPQAHSPKLVYKVLRDVSYFGGDGQRRGKNLTRVGRYQENGCNVIIGSNYWSIVKRDGVWQPKLGESTKMADAIRHAGDGVVYGAKSLED